VQSFQKTLQTIGAQLKALSPTARLLIGSLMVILVMTLFLVSLYAGRQSMAPLGLSATMSEDARARAISYLQSHDIPHEVKGGDVLVPIDQKYSLLAKLTESHVIGADQINFEKLMSDDSPFRTRDQNRQRYLVAKMNVLGNMISQMSGIQRATVVIDQPEGMSAIGKANIPASASVNVLPNGGELTQGQVDAIAHLVGGSHAGLKREHVSIVDARTGRAMRARTDDVLNSGKYMEVKLEAERHAKATIEDALHYIPGVRVAVNAQVDTTEVIQKTSSFDEPKLGMLNESTSAISSSNSTPIGEPGVRINTGLDIGNTSRAGSQSMNERSETSSVPAFGKRDSQIKDAKGYALRINASVSVPKSYFVRLFQDRQGAASEPGAQPDVASLDALVLTETERIKKHIAPLIDTQPLDGALAGAITVDMFPDFGAMLVNAETFDVASTGGARAGSGMLSDGLVKYVTLGSLVLMSIAMMFLMVRKASVREQLPTASELVGIPPALAAAESDLVGEADEASPALEGVELNDDAIRRTQMLEQITDMVSDSPEDAAALLRRWMKTEA
jgi:flagellar M-ring protein FliF